MSKNPLVSVIIPTYNEGENIVQCLVTLQQQNYKPIEIIVVDDGSTDRTLKIIEDLKSKILNLKSFQQSHAGPGAARNLGAKEARGEILIFVDADMNFEKNFIEKLTVPIREGKAIGTFSKDEMLKNTGNIWAVCWNINRQVRQDELYTLRDKLFGFFWNIFTPAAPERMHHPKSSNFSPVFRAILKEKFLEVGGFTPTGEYTDDWSLSRKLGVKAANTPGAIFYHSNPETLSEVWKQARWIGKNEFISGTILRRVKSLIKYSFPMSLLIGIVKSVINFNFYFLIFKLVYDLAIFTSVVLSFFGEKKFK